MKLTLTLFGVFLSMICFAQGIYPDSTTNRIREADCEGRVFVKFETLPLIRGSVGALGDSITNYLKERNASLKNSRAVFRLLLTSKSQLLEIKKIEGEQQDEAAFKDALLLYANMWIPARQNGYIVCSYVKLEVRVVDGKMFLAIGQVN